jgi:hypothetical protein
MNIFDGGLTGGDEPVVPAEPVTPAEPAAPSEETPAA